VSIEEIVHTCSNEQVAQAAVASLGFAFATRVWTQAEGQGVTMGAFAARVVHEFGKSADAGERRAVHSVMDKADQPILVGLRFILEGRLRLTQSASHRQWPMGTLSFPLGPNLAFRHAE
jgi:hypothetical protein